MTSFGRQYSASVRKNLWLARNKIGLLICCQIIIPLLMTGQTVMLLYLPRLFTSGSFLPSSSQIYSSAPSSVYRRYDDPMCKNVTECYFAFAPLNSTVRQQMEPYYSQWKSYLIPTSSWERTQMKPIFLNDADEMETLAKANKLYGGVVFDGAKNDSHTGNPIPSVSYRIRLAAESLPVPPPLSLKSNVVLSMILGFGSANNRWAYSGFYDIQNFVDNAVIRWAVDLWNNATVPYGSNPLPRPGESAFQVRYGPQYPNPPLFAGFMIPQAASAVQIAFIGPVLLAAMDLVRERSSRIREYLKIMGLRDTAYWASWITTIMGGELFCLIVVTSIYYGVGVVTPASFFLPILNWIACCFALVCFGLLVATVAPTPTVVTVSLLFWLYGTSQIGLFFTGSSLAASVALCLIAPIAGQFAGVEIYKLELLELGVSKLNTEMLGSFPLYLAILMQFIDGILYLILTWYISNLRGSGIEGADGAGSRPWYFPFMPSFWCPREANVFEDTEDGVPLTDSAMESGDFEAQPPESLAAIRLRGLRKVYTSAAVPTVAVKKLDLEIAQNQIFCLLGENGAGKTTTISMLTGLTAPTDGDAIIGGYSIKDQLELARNSISICPQHDMLLEELSGRQHLTLFARLKGVPEPLVESAVNRALADVNLTEKADTNAKDYSGGMKRRLSLAISLVADSRVVFLDEPSSGLDPVSRRQVWEMLKRKRDGKCIILTTHFMEEAEVLADRIGIMSFGRLVCGGSPEFLKHRFGTGYALTIALDENKIQRDNAAAANHVADFVKSFIPSASLASTNGQDVTIRLPLNATKSFPDLFANLEQNLGSLGATTFGVAMTTLEDVFLAISRRESDNQQESPAMMSSDDVNPMHHTHNDEESGLLLGENSPGGRASLRDRVLNGKPAPFFQQLKLMLLMRAKLAWRSKWSTLASLIYPLIIVAAITAVSSGGGFGDQMFDILDRHATGEVVPLNIEASLPLIVPTFINITSAPPLSEVQNLFAGINNGPLESSITFPTFPGSDWKQSGFYDYIVFNRTAELLDGAGAILFDSTSKLAFNSSFSPSASLVVMNNNSDYAAYAAPTMRNFASNLMMSAMLRTSGAYRGDTLKLSMSSWPFVNATNSTNNMIRFRPPKQQGIALDQSFLIALASTFSVVMAGVAQMIVAERFKKQKKQLELAGALSSAYWTPIIVLETLKLFFTYCLIYLLVILTFNLRFYTASAAASLSYFLSGIIFIIGFVFFNCVIQRLFDDPESCRKWITAINVGSAALPFLIRFIVLFVTMLNSKDGEKFPSLETLSEYAPSITPLGSFLAGLHSLANANDEKLVALSDIFSWTYSGKWLVFMAIHLVLFAILHFFLESRSLNIRRHPYRPPQHLAGPPIQHIDDPDVVSERQRVHGDAAQDPIRVLDATKFYHFKRAAVDDVAFSVRPHECFGLLGPNGAGKTTLISGITGEVALGFGDIQIDSKSIYQHNVSSLFRSVALGECMQVDALFEELTTEESVKLFIGLRNDFSPLGGSASADRCVDIVITDILDRMHLTSNRKKQAKALSGGNKRKLSTATALLTGTQICLLDEPSTGMDPSMRRALWTVLKQEREERGSSILLTTHSMEEAEATCTRISIMVMGRLQCIGSNQHLKSRFGETYRLHVVLDLANPAVNPASIDAFVKATFGEQSRFIEGHGAHGTYDVGIVKSISAAFAALETNMQQLGLLSYSLSQATLEQIFLQFAKQQELDPSTA